MAAAGGRAAAAAPAVATIFQGGANDDASALGEDMAQRVCRRTGQVVFVSYSLPVPASPDEALMLEVERCVAGLVSEALADQKAATSAAAGEAKSAP